MARRLRATSGTSVRRRNRERRRHRATGAHALAAAAQGLRAHVVADYVGERWLNKRNTALADSYTTIDAGVGYAFDRWELRLDGYNLSDRRDAVAESELGDAQYYRLPARSYWLSARYTFGAR